MQFNSSTTVRSQATANRQDQQRQPGNHNRVNFVPSSAPGRARGLELSPAQRADLEQMARKTRGSAARWARIILMRAGGVTLAAIAAAEGVHRDTVRRCLQRFRRLGFAGLRHGNTGKPKNLVFDARVRREIARRASQPPAEWGESFPFWSLCKLRNHLVRAGVVRTISVERLRYVLHCEPHSITYWRRTERASAPLSREVRQQLVALAQHSDGELARRARAVLAVTSGASLAEVAREANCGKSSLRRWLDHVRVAGVARLISTDPRAATLHAA